MSAVPFSISRFKAETSDIALQGWDSLNHDVADWVKALRVRSQSKVSEFGLPNTKLERWKFTNIAPKLKKMALTPSKAEIVISGNDAFVSNDINADWVRALAEAAPAGEAQYADMMLWHAANAYFDNALVVDVPAKAVGQDALVINVNGKAGQYNSPQFFIRVADNADFTIIENHNGEGEFWNNALTHVMVGKNARLRHYRIQENSKSSVYTQNTYVTVERDGNYESFTLSTGSALYRNQIHGELLAENGVCSMGGLNMLSGSQHGDTALLVEHKAPNCQSNQLFKTILNDESRGVFQGKIHVHQIAQLTNGYQLSNNLLLSPLAEMDIKPELEIYADDVKCSHGSTTGQLDETPMFYLRSRGLSETEARKLLLEAFIGQATETITDEAVQEVIVEKATAWLETL